jgi:TrmH family RNA methyltransferase
LLLIIGNEGQGMHNNLKILCDKMVNIKMNSKCESLNAGVAASILMSEVYHE